MKAFTHSHTHIFVVEFILGPMPKFSWDEVTSKLNCVILATYFILPSKHIYVYAPATTEHIY